MKQITILGAGKSSSHLIRHLVSNRAALNIRIVILDIHTKHLAIYSDLDYIEIHAIPSGSVEDYRPYVSQSYITVSMLPAFMHIDIAKLCLQYTSHLITPSYISEEMQSLSEDVVKKELIFLNELGFDPGIDHLTTMKIYNEIIDQGGILTSYRSYAGGLVAPRSDNNPWHYKFSWNPRNVILAGQGGDIKYKKNGVLQTLPYKDLFPQSENLVLSNGEEFDAYANRDSLKYEKLYGWEKIQTLLRGTLRKKGFCEAWAVLVTHGITDDTLKNRPFKGKTYHEFYASILQMDVIEFLQNQTNSIREKLEYIGFLDTHSQIEIDGSAAEILQSILSEKWKLNEHDTDWVVMVHLFEYILNGKKYELESYFSLEGESKTYTAMSKTVGMPIAFAIEMILNKEVKARGVLMPTSKELYLPILKQLEGIGISFKESIREI